MIIERFSKPIVAIFAAIALAIGLSYAYLALSKQWPSAPTTENVPPSDAEKIKILRALAGTSTPGIEERRAQLKELSAQSESAPLSEEERLRMLGSLRER